MHLSEESACDQSHIPIEILSIEKIAPLITTSMVIDNEKTGVLEYEGLSPTAMNGDFKLLTEKMNKVFHSRGFDLICRRCGEPITVGSLYHRTGLSRKTKSSIIRNVGKLSFIDSHTVCLRKISLAF
jgi:hypothetical protein